MHWFIYKKITIYGNYCTFKLMIDSLNSFHTAEIQMAVESENCRVSISTYNISRVGIDFVWLLAKSTLVDWFFFLCSWLTWQSKGRFKKFVDVSLRSFVEMYLLNNLINLNWTIRCYTAIRHKVLIGPVTLSQFEIRQWFKVQERPTAATFRCSAWKWGI